MTRPPRVFGARRVVQWTMAVFIVVLGVRFGLWVTAHMSGRWPSVGRPPGVEGFLPIDGMLAFRHWLLSGQIDPIHPAALAIFVGICAMSLLVAKSFCSTLCPVGLLSELLGRLGIRLLGRNLRLPRWLDLPLRSLKFLLLGFFAWAVWVAMSPSQVHAFLESPYAKMVDAKMWLFFAHPSRLTIAVLGVLIVGSIFIRDLWCRYLCPYGALLGVLGRFAPFKVTRDSELCTDCRGCTAVCPAQLKVHEMGRVASIECTSCQDCVAVCPVEGCLAIRPPLVPRRKRVWLRPAVGIAVAVGVYLVIVMAFRLAGHWETSVSEAEYHRRLPEISSPLYTHVGGMAMTEESAGLASQTPDGEMAGVASHGSSSMK